PVLGFSDGTSFCPREIECRRANDAELESIRGGFSLNTPAGRLEINIGITRTVEVNDRVVAVSRLVLPDLTRILAAARSSADAARIRADVTRAPASVTPVPHGARVDLAGGALVLPNGPGNVAPVAAAFQGTALPTIVQNSLNDQVLRKLTFVNASVNSVSALKSLGWGEMMQRATAATAR